MLHFAYGSNMHRGIMGKHAPEAVPAGTATLVDHRFLITGDGYASVEPLRAAIVHGVLWRITPRDRITLDLWESVGRGLYRAVMLPVQQSGGRRPALVYIARPSGEGRPKAGYMEIVIAAARQWRFPQSYLASLERWLPSASAPPGPRKLGEFEI